MAYGKLNISHYYSVKLLVAIAVVATLPVRQVKVCYAYVRIQLVKCATFYFYYKDL